MPNRSDIKLCIDTANELKNLLWISLTPRGFISVGFPDHTFEARSLLISHNDVRYLETVDVAASYSQTAIKNPHFTFHPPGHFHLKSEDGTVLYERVIFADEDSKWLKFVSKNIESLPYYLQPPHGREVQIFKLVSPRSDCSVAVDIDFVKTPGPTHLESKKISHYLSWGQITLKIVAYCVPVQEPSLSCDVLG